jgi:hypothetical protein
MTDLREFPYMPLYIQRLQRSKAWLRCKRRPELAFYMVNLWMRAWHEVPAGMIENDDDVLADAAMADPWAWDKIKADVLYGWHEQGGFLVHPVIAEIAQSLDWQKYPGRVRRGVEPHIEIPQAEWLRLRDAVFARDRYACVYCGTTDVKFECDHVLPRTLGGLSVLENLATACGGCNRSKGGRPLSIWKPGFDLASVFLTNVGGDA